MRLVNFRRRINVINRWHCYQQNRRYEYRQKKNTFQLKLSVICDSPSSTMRGISCYTCFLLLIFCVNEGTANPPHIVFILADDFVILPILRRRWCRFWFFCFFIAGMEWCQLPWFTANPHSKFGYISLFRLDSSQLLCDSTLHSIPLCLDDRQASYPHRSQWFWKIKSTFTISYPVMIKSERQLIFTHCSWLDH